ncbi:MAG TPA: WW domain binding protein 11 [Methylocella sp.]|nr:WW domain binding protein 11 [Methylocella sp.]
MNGLETISVAKDTRRLRRELAELKEMVRLGAGIPGDKQRIEVLERLLTHGPENGIALVIDECDPEKMLWRCELGPEGQKNGTGQKLLALAGTLCRMVTRVFLCSATSFFANAFIA